MSELLQIPADLTDVRLTRHRSAVIKLETQEELPDELVAKLAGYAGKQGWWTFSVEQINPESIANLPKLPKFDGKSPAERLHSVIYVHSQQKDVPKDKVNEFYDRRMSYHIELEKGELEPYEETHNRQT